MLSSRSVCVSLSLQFSFSLPPAPPPQKKSPPESVFLCESVQAKTGIPHSSYFVNKSDSSLCENEIAWKNSNFTYIRPSAPWATHSFRLLGLELFSLEQREWGCLCQNRPRIHFSGSRKSACFISGECNTHGGKGGYGLKNKKNVVWFHFAPPLIHDSVMGKVPRSCTF